MTTVPTPGEPDGTSAPLRLTYDATANAAYLALGASHEASKGGRTIPIGLGGAEHDVDVLLDIDANGVLIGVEVLGARTRLAPDVLAAAHRLDEQDDDLPL